MFSFGKDGALSGVLESVKTVLSPKVAQCSGMTPIGSVPSGDQSAAVAQAQAQQAKDMGLPIGTASNATSKEQLEALEKQKAELEKKLGVRPNPGAYDKADGDAKHVLNPEYFDGFRMLVNKSLSSKFQTSHDFWLGSQMVGGNQYHFGAHVVPSDNLMLISRIDPQGQLDAQVHASITANLTSRLITMCSPDPSRSVVQLDMEYKGSDFTGGVKLSQGPYVSASYFQSVTQNIALGGEGIYYGSQGVAHAFFRGKYQDEKNQATLTYSTINSLTANYVRSVNDKVRLAAELEVNLSSNESLMNFGWEFGLRQALVRGTVSTEGILATHVTHRLEPGFSIFMNAIMDHSKDTHRFGYGVQFG